MEFRFLAAGQQVGETTERGDFGDPAHVWPTTEKTRLMGRAEGKHSQQLLRVDRESLEPLSLDRFS